MSVRTPATIAELVKLHGDVQVMPASFGQQRFWLLDQLDDSAAYTLPVGVRLHGQLDESALEGAINAIIARHEALRTVFAVEGDEPMQVVLPSVAIELGLEDLSALAPDEREAAVKARANANSNASFDLARGPLVRASLLRLSDDEHVLLLLMHHIAADGWSIGIFFNELEIAYAALINGAEPVFSPLPLQYPDFAVWQRRAMQGSGAARQIAYWKERLQGATPIELPTDHPRPPLQTLNGAHRELMIDGAVAEGIRTLARREGATAFTGFLAAFFALLQRYTSQTDLVVGSITSGRRRPEVEPIIGLFLNTLAIRADVSPDRSFLELLHVVRDRATEALANQDVPFEHVVDAIAPPRDRSRSPIFQVAFQLLETLQRDLKLPGLTASRVSGSKTSAKFELTLMLHHAPNGGLRAVLEYNTDLFDGETIERMLAHYATLLASVVSDPATPVSRLAVMTTDEYALVTERWNDTAAPLPDWNMPSRVLAMAAAQPDAIAVRAGTHTLSYSELAGQSAAIAERLASLSIAAGHRVAVCMDRSTALVSALLGVQRSGAAYVPLDASHPADRLAHVLSDAGVSAVLTDAVSAPRLPACDAPVIVVDDALLAGHAGAAVFSAALIDPESAAYVIYTSGSTGKPKGVAVPHRALANFLASMSERPGISRSDALVAVTTVAFDIAGLELWLPLVNGARVELASRDVASDGIALRQLIEATTASAPRVVVQATPATWTLLIEAGWKGADTVVVLCGGEAWPPRLADTLLPRCAELWNVYGPTETTIWSSRHLVTRADYVPLGEPLANTSLLVLEQSGEPAPLGVPGELWIGGAGLAIGYHWRPDLTEERFVTHPRFGRLYRTGDRVKRRADGSLEYLGRLDQQIKLRGYRIELGEIESVLAEQPDVVQAVAAVRHANEEARIVAYVVLAPGANQAVAVSALDEPLRRALPDYMVPSAIVVLEALPLNPSGKVDRRALPDPAQWVSQAAEFVPARTPMESLVAEAWQGVLSVERVGMNDGFFALGGNSMAATRVAVRLGDLLGTTVPVRVLFEQLTPAAVARWLDENVAAANDDLADVLAELDALSDEEAAALLAEEESR